MLAASEEVTFIVNKKINLSVKKVIALKIQASFRINFWISILLLTHLKLRDQSIDIAT